MKILFKTIQRPKNQLRMDEQADYQSDLLFHGLRTLFGEQCVDVPKKDYMYETYPKEMAGQLWGRGFTYSRTLEDIPVDRTLSPKDADLVIFSIHHSVQFLFDYQIEEYIKLCMPSNKIAVVDGHDWPKYNEKLASLCHNYFKRELDGTARPHMKPVWFAIPKEKMVTEVPNKVRDFARIYPGSTEPHWPKNSRASHVFTTEEDYYKEYQESRFAFTCKKGGWDCMRHMEILGNGCIPIFTDIENCPSNTCFNLPKRYLSLLKMSPLSIFNHKGEKVRCAGGHEIDFPRATWEGTEEHFLEMINDILFKTISSQYYTTEALATYFLKNINNGAW